MYEQTFPHKRYENTLRFLQKHVPAPASILDLGVHNPFVKFMEDAAYSVTNTNGEDLDLHIESVQNSNADVVTAFEIFEHLVSPFPIINAINARKLVASVPLNLWFSKAYQSKTDPWDRHYHEFEDWQFDWLLEKANWKIIASEKWVHPVHKLGIRPLLRRFIPRYYIVYAERTSL